MGSLNEQLLMHQSAMLRDWVVMLPRVGVFSYLLGIISNSANAISNKLC